MRSRPSRGNVVVRVSRVLTTGGFEVGTADDVQTDTTTGEPIGVITADRRIDAERLRSLGSYALVVEPG